MIIPFIALNRADLTLLMKFHTYWERKQHACYSRFSKKLYGRKITFRATKKLGTPLSDEFVRSRGHSGERITFFGWKPEPNRAIKSR